MATITSSIRLQDNATATFSNINSGIDKTISKSQKLNQTTSTLSSNVDKMSVPLRSANKQYDQMVKRQERVNAKIEGMTGSSNRVAKARERLIHQSDMLTRQLTSQEKIIESMRDDWLSMANGGGPKVDSGGFSGFGANLIKMNQGIELAKKVGSAVGSLTGWADEQMLISARLNLINDGLQTTTQLQDKISAAANRSRGEYDAMAATVSKLGLLAGDAFSSNDELIYFTETMQKAFKVSGASAQESSNAMYQLSQAMASGRLQGDEFRSIIENAPMLAQAIADYTGVGMSKLRELASEGAITSDIIKASLFNAAGDIEDKFAEMPMTFSDAMNKMKNDATRYFQPIVQRISEIINSEQFQTFTSNVTSLLFKIAAAALVVLNVGITIVNWVSQNIPLVLSILGLLAAFYFVTMPLSLKATTDALWAQAAAWMAANWQMVLLAGIALIIIGVMYALEAPMWALVAVIGVIVAVMAAWKIAQWAVNSAMYACPIVWIIVLVVALIVAIFAFMQWMAKATGLANSGLGMIAGGVMVVIGFFKNLGLAVANIALGIWNALGAVAENIGVAFNNVIKSIQSWFYGLLGTVMDVIAGIVKTLNKLPFVDIDMSGIESKAKEYADKKAGAEAGKQDYKDIGEAFDKGMNTFEAFKDGWVMEEFNKGAAWGDSVQGKIEGMLGSFNPDEILGKTKQNPYEFKDLGSQFAGDGMPVNVKGGKLDEVDISEEDIKYLKDMASKEFMVKYKQITPNVNIQFGDVKETADVDAVGDRLKQMMEDQLSELYVEEGA